MFRKSFAVAGENIRRFIRNTQIDTENKFLLEVSGEGFLNLSGVEDISEYTDNYIFVVSDKKFTEIDGKNLHLDYYGSRKIVVAGQIDSIRFLDR